MLSDHKISCIYMTYIKQRPYNIYVKIYHAYIRLGGYGTGGDQTRPAHIAGP